MLIRPLLLVVAFGLTFPVAALPASGATLPDSARACVSTQTPITKTLRAIALASRPGQAELQLASMVLCVKRIGLAQLAVRTFSTTACRGEWKAANFAVRYGGGDYTTFAQCVRHKMSVAKNALARAQTTGSKPCTAQLLAKSSLWQEESSRFGFGVYVVPGRC
jgi:hypothetical protein